MVAFDSSSHNSHSWRGNDYDGINMNEYRKMISTDTFKKYPCFTREDFFDYMVEMGVDCTLAFDASERIRKEHAGSCGIYHQQFPELPIPDEIKDIAKNYLYIFPRAHSIE